MKFSIHVFARYDIEFIGRHREEQKLRGLEKEIGSGT